MATLHQNLIPDFATLSFKKAFSPNSDAGASHVASIIISTYIQNGQAAAFMSRISPRVYSFGFNSIPNAFRMRYRSSPPEFSI